MFLFICLSCFLQSWSIMKHWMRMMPRALKARLLKTFRLDLKELDFLSAKNIPLLAANSQLNVQMDFIFEIDIFRTPSIRRVQIHQKFSNCMMDFIFLATLFILDKNLAPFEYLMLSNSSSWLCLVWLGSTSHCK